MGLFSFNNETKGHQLLSKIATNDGHGETSLYFDGWKAYDSNPFHHIHNPKGVIQMGLAENQLSVDLIQEWIRNNPQASICTAEGVSDFGAISIFQDYHGLQSFRQGVAKFMEKVRGGRVKFDPNRIVMSGGATGAQEVVSFCLADPGDAFLVPTPYYPGSDRDFCWRTGAKLIPVECKSSNNFQITEEALESAYKKAFEQNMKVKGILATNPSNPLGTTMDKDTLKTLVSFVNDKNIHLVCDELYGGTVFKKPDFVSVAEILQEDPSCNPNLIHIVSSLSKDLGLPGFRIGIIYSYNDAVVSCARKMSSFGLVSTQTQHLIASMLSDDDFTSNYLATSAMRLAEAREIFTAGLKKVGIHCLESNAGLYCWMDLRSMLKNETVEAEMELWKVIINDVKLNVSPGSSFHCSEPGWFRVCFANMDGETMNVALKRIWSFVTKVNGARVQPKNKKNFNPVLRLSLPRRYEDLGMMSPSILSPQSPLVHAQT